jgi:metacaspase-1
MATGISLHLGLNSYDPDHYSGYPPLLGAERDAKAMAQIAERTGFTPALLLAGDATFDTVRARIADAAAKLRAGDIFLFTFAGHGSTVPDQNGDEPTGCDQTICLYDQQIVDDLLYSDFSAFAKGVRILMVSDSCHSGTVARDLFYAALRAAPGIDRLIERGAARALPPALASSVYLAHQAQYDAQQTPATAEAAENVAASILLLAACQDLQEARDGAFHGKFTSALLTVWNGGKYLQSLAPSYSDFLARIGGVMADPSQVPNLFRAGADDPMFARAVPFAL